MPTMLCPHWIPVHTAAPDLDFFRAWNPPFVKVVTVDDRPPHLDQLPPDAQLIIRSHPMSEGLDGRGFRDVQHASAEGARDAEYCFTMARYAQTAYGITADRLLFEGRNEPMVWSSEPPALTAAYYAQFLRRLHAHNLHGVALNLGVGWPGNDGPDRPPMWTPFKPVIDAMYPGDYIGLHEYWGFNGPDENWRWWAGRFMQCPYDVPFLITECGDDFGVCGLGGNGWLSQYSRGDTPTAKAVNYMADLARYEALAAADGRAVALFVFTHDGQEQDWWTFDTRHPELTARILAHADTLRAVPLPPGTRTKPQPDAAFAALQTAIPTAINLTHTLPHHAVLRYETRPLSKLTHITIHHTATPPSTTPEEIARAHVTANNWPSIGYHYFVTVAGQLYQTNDPATVSYHAGNANAYAVSICLPGDYTTDTPTPAAIATVARLIQFLRQYTGRPLLVNGHRDVNNTACPGDNLYALLPGLNAPQVDLDDVQRAAWNAVGIPYHPTYALQRAARDRNLGAPLTDEFHVEPWICQAYADGIVYCQAGDWGNVKIIPW